MGFIPTVQGQVNIHKLLNVIYNINKLKIRTHIIILIGAENRPDKIEHPLVIKTLNKVSIEGIYLDIIKAIYGKPMADITLSQENLKATSLQSSSSEGCSLLLLLFSTVLEVLAIAIKEEKQI